MADKNATTPCDLPMVLTPKDVAIVLGISRNKAYEVLHSKDFPAFQIGKQYRVHREQFVHWLNGSSGKKIA